LFAQGARIMNECKPKISIIENVEGLLSNDKGNTIRTVLRTLNAIGYRVYMDLLNTKDFGGKTPQNRSRVYIICERKN
jgi:DNA (cytosine-5)-methyltransferase 1